MASAPGQSSAQQEPVCYNCGLKGHWVVACPEPTREVPAGLQRWQSQHHDQAQRPGQRQERHNPNAEKKPPVVTRYAPPPAYPLPAPQYGQPPPPPPPYPPAGQPPYPPSQYPPPQQPPYYAAGYPPPPPGQAPYGSYPPQPPPPPPVHYTQHHPPPPQPPYGPPPPGNPYPQPTPPPPPGYYNGHQPPYPPAPYQPVPLPAPANYQVPPFPPSGPPPPPPIYNPAPYPSAQYPPNPVSGYAPAPLPPPPIPPPPLSYSPDSTWGQPPLPPNSSQPGKHYQRGRNKKHRDRDRRPSDRPKGHKGFDRHRSPPVVKSVLPDDEAATIIESRTGTLSQDEPEPGEVAEDGNEEDEYEDWSVDVDKHFDIVFAEAEGKPADPVGIPLPHTYTEDPTIPPAYNATCIKSAFFEADGKDRYVIPVQKSKEWPLLQDDPAFRRYPGMIERRFDGFDGLVYDTYETPVRHPKGAPVKLPPRFRFEDQARQRPFYVQRFSRDEGEPRPGWTPDRDKRPFFKADRDGDFRRGPDTPQRGGFNRTPHERPVKRGLEESRHSDQRDFKRHRISPSYQDTPPSTGRDTLTNRSPPVRPDYDYERSAWSPHADVDYDNRAVSRHRDRSSERHHQREKSANPRHDSGYHSGQSPDKTRQQRRDRDEEPKRQRQSRSRERSYSRARHSRSRSPVSRASSPSASDDRSRSNSPLTAMDYELLGLSRPKEKKAPAGVALGKKLAKRPVKVSAAYGRRW